MAFVTRDPCQPAEMFAIMDLSDIPYSSSFRHEEPGKPRIPGYQSM